MWTQIIVYGNTIINIGSAFARFDPTVEKKVLNSLAISDLFDICSLHHYIQNC